MSGLEVIGGISAVISILDASIKIYDSVKNDIKLPKSFEVIRRRLPVLLHTLEPCKSQLESRHDGMPEDVCEALQEILYSCRAKAKSLEEVFEKIMPGPSDTRHKRYLKALQRLGKGNKAEELMGSITEDVQIIVNHHAVKSADPRQNFEVTFRQKEDFSFRRPVGVCLSQAPYIAAELFVGRGSELDKIAEILDPVHEVQRQRRLVLGGMGGIGKTQLAIAYAESQSGSYSSVFWLNAASEATLKDSFRSIATLIFDVQDPQFLESREIIRRVYHWLSDSANIKWLLIFDNYDNPSQFYIHDYYPHTSYGSIIVTTRWPDHVAGITLHVKPFQDIKDSLAILQIRSQRENIQSDPYAKRLAKRLDGLPLALATAGTYLQRSALTFERYLQEYEKRWDIDPRRPTKLQEYRERTLYTTWDLSYARLEIEDLDAAKLLKLLAYFGNENLWYELFHDGLTKGSPQWLYELVADHLSFQGVMRILTEYYFLEVHLASGSWSMHNCVHDWTLAALNKNVDTEHYWYAFDCIDATVSAVDTGSFGLITFSRSASHATRLVQQRFLESEMLSDLTPNQLDKISRVSKLLRGQIQLAAAEQMFLRALDGYEKALGPNHISTLDTVHNLGNLYCDQGMQDEAEQMYMRALAGKEKALGLNHISTLGTVNNLGVLYRHQGKLDEAERMFMRALAGCEKALGPDHTSTLDIINNLGNLYGDQGRLDEAEQMYMRALAGCEKALGLNHTSTLDTVNNLGILYRHQSKLDEAERMFIRALAGCEKALGPNHISTLDTVHNLGNLYSDQGKLDDAKQMYMRALDGYEKALGPNHTSTLDTINNIRNLYRDRGRLDETEQMFMRVGSRKKIE